MASPQFFDMSWVTLICLLIKMWLVLILISVPSTAQSVKHFFKVFLFTIDFLKSTLLIGLLALSRCRNLGQVFNK